MPKTRRRAKTAVRRQWGADGRDRGRPVRNAHPPDQRDRPAAVRVYADAEHDEAARYATEIGGEVVPLPLSPPTGYTAGLCGSLVPPALSEADQSPA
jgi:hypothetical protein